MVSKQSLHSLQKLEPSSTLCNRCNPQNVASQAAERVCYALQSNHNLSRNAIATQVAKKIAQCRTRCGSWFYYLQRLQRFFERIASCSRTLQHVTCLPQLAVHSYSPCVMSVQYTRGCAVHWGMFSMLGDLTEYTGGVQYTGVFIQIQLFSQ